MEKHPVFTVEMAEDAFIRFFDKNFGEMYVVNEAKQMMRIAYLEAAKTAQDYLISQLPKETIE